MGHDDQRCLSAPKPADAPAGHPGGTARRWRCRVARGKWICPYRTRRPPVSAGIAPRIGRLATGHNGWGYQRIQGEWLTPGYRVSVSAIHRVRKALRIAPAPSRRTGATWRRFRHAPAAAMLAAGLFDVDCAMTLHRLCCSSVIDAGYGMSISPASQPIRAGRGLLSRSAIW